MGNYTTKQEYDSRGEQNAPDTVTIPAKLGCEKFRREFWEVGEDRGHHCVLSGDRVIAYCGVVGARDDAESRVNAQLIAAAPMLLDTLETLKELEFRGGSEQEYADAHYAIHNIIAKAVGGTK